MHKRTKSQYLSLVLYKTYAELRAESARTYVGFVWWITEPVINMAIYYLVFAVFLARGTEDFVPFLLIGLVSFKWFSVSVMMGANSIRANIPLMRQAYLPKSLFPIVSTLMNFVKFTVSFAVLLIFLWLYGFEPTGGYALLPALILLQFLLGLGCALVFAAIVPLLPDLVVVLENVIRLMFFLSGIFFAGDRIPEEYRFYFYLNPVAQLITSYRDVLMHGAGSTPDEFVLMLGQLGWIAGIAIALMAIGLLLLRKLDRVYPRLVT